MAAQYRFGLEQALAKARFTSAPDITLCQAFLLRLLFVQPEDDARSTWILTGLLTRMSQYLGLHRDGTNFSALTPFETEMRRRLFWAIFIFDWKSADDQGVEVSTMHRSFDTQVPLNVNDSDMAPDCTELPQPREGATDCIFCVLRYDIASTFRLNPALASQSSGLSLTERNEILVAMYDRVIKKYRLDESDENLSSPLHYLSKNVTRLIRARMIFFTYQLYLFPGAEIGRDGVEARSQVGGLTRSERDLVFAAAIDIFECSLLLATDPRTRQWRWLVQTYTQCHAVAYVMLDVTKRPWSSSVERAWTALASVLAQSQGHQLLQKLTGNSTVWFPFRKLWIKARRHRDAEIARLLANPDEAQKLDLEECAKTVQPALGSPSSSVAASVAHERWRKLVNAPPPSQEAARAQRRPVMVSTASTSSAPTGQGNFPDEQVMQMLGDSLMSSQIDMPHLASLAWAEQAGGTGAGANPSANVARMSNQPRRSAVGQNRGGVQQGSPPPNAYLPPGPMTTPAVTAQPRQSFPQDDSQQASPWLWNNMSGVPAGGVSSSLSMTPLDSGAGIAVVPEAQYDELDMTMDEGFDWQHWQESLGKLELEMGGSAGGVWGHGI